MNSCGSKMACNFNIDSELTNLPFPEEFHPEGHLISNIITPPSIPDGGFGWLCVIGTFLINFVIDGVNGSVGIFLPAINEYYNSTTEETSLILSMLILFIYIMSPVAAILLDKFSSRVLVIFFGFLAAFSVFVTYFAKSVSIITFTFGVLPGASFSICVVASQVMISLYFDRRRALAYSIAGVGSGCGAILMPVLTSIVIKQHGFRNVFFFLGGICSFLGISGPLFIPLKLTDEKGQGINTIAQEIVTNADIHDESAVYMRDVKGVSIDYGNSFIDDMLSMRKFSSSQFLNFGDPIHKSQSRVRFVLKEKSKKLKENFSLMTVMKRNATVSFKQRMIRGNSTVRDLSNIYKVLSGKPKYVPNSTAKNLNIINNENSFYNQVLNCYTGNATFTGLLCRINDVIERSNTRKKNMKMFSHSEGDLFRTKYGNKYNIITQNPFIDKKTLTFLKKWIHDLMLKPMNRADIFFKGSRKQLIDQGLIEDEPDIRDIIHVPKMETKKTFWGNFSHIFGIIADTSIFKIPQLIIYIIAISLFSWATYVPMLFIVLFAEKFTTHANYLPSIIGGGSVLGQLMCGVVVSYCEVKPRTISEVAFYLSGIFTAGIAALEGHFEPLIVVCLFFGFTYGILLTTWQSILCDVAGIRRLSSSLSFYLVCRGISIFIGVYSSSILSEKIGIQNTFYFASSILALSAIIHSCMRFAPKNNSNL